MQTRKPMVAGNWKMNGSLELVNDLSATLKNSDLDGVDVAIIPPAMLLSSVLQSGLNAGVQTVSEHESGAYTGETQATLAKALGATYTLVGHSERRQLFAESDQSVAAKFMQAKQAGLTPILCVGETEQQREQGQTEAVINAQLDAIITQFTVAAFADSVIAYEPVWAIGTGKTASPEQAQAVHQFIRAKLSQLDAQLAQNLTLLYGGSVNESNSEVLFAQPDIDGGLIGGASLKPQSFLAICESAKRIK